MATTVKVQLELVYEDGNFDPVKMAKRDLQDMPWARMVATKAKVVGIEQVTERAAGKG